MTRTFWLKVAFITLRVLLYIIFCRKWRAGFISGHPLVVVFFMCTSKLHFYFHHAWRFQKNHNNQTRTIKQPLTASQYIAASISDFYILVLHSLGGGAVPAAMDRESVSTFSTEQLLHLILIIIHELCARFRVSIDHTSVFTFQFPAASFAQLGDTDIEAPRDPSVASDISDD